MNKDKKPLSETHPELAKEAFGWDPEQYTAGSHSKKEWRCKKNHIWISGIDQRTRKGRKPLGCPICSNRKILKGFNDLATTHPELAKEAFGWDPTTVIAGTAKKLKWKCNKNHTWTVSVENRSRKNVKSNCPICSNKKILKNYNDLHTKYPQIAIEANGWDPREVLSGSGKKLSWICEKKHVWEEKVINRTRNKMNCPYCSNHRLLKGFNDLATSHPELALEAFGWNPNEELSGNNKKFRWKCRNNHIYATTISKRKMGTGCPYCSNSKLQIGFNDLQTINPKLASEANGWDPRKVLSGSGKKLSWICKKKHVWESTLDNRITKNKNCPYCSNRKILRGFNDLATTHPDIAREANGWDPTKVFANSPKKMSWKCSNNHLWTTSPNSRSRTNCPSCASTGFDPNKKSFLYFLLQPKWEIYQIGITNDLQERLKKHKRNGFDLLEVRGPMDGHSAQELETAMLRYLKKQKADLSPQHIAGKFDGYSESWTIDSYKVNNLKELIDKAREAGY